MVKNAPPLPVILLVTILMAIALVALGSQKIRVSLNENFAAEPNQSYGGNNAQFISQNVPATMQVGKSYPITIVMKNIGRSTWTRALQYKLGRGDDFWRIGRVELSTTETVAPNQIKSFNFTITAPSTPGTYAFQYGMLRENVEWFGPVTPKIMISVGGGATPLPQSDSINTLDYFISKHTDTGLTGSHPIAQRIDGNSSYYFKFGGLSSYEMHTWDDTYIYLSEDHSDNSPYSFSPGIWMKRSMKIGERIDVSANKIRRYSVTNNCTLTSTSSFPYSMVLESHIANYQAGGDLGYQDVIVVAYHWSNTSTERFYYSKEWGWIRWEAWEGNTMAGYSVFNKKFAYFNGLPDAWQPAKVCSRPQSLFVSGRVYDATCQKGLPNVSVQNCSYITTTDGNGNYYFSRDKGQGYCARIADGVPAGLTSMRAIKSRVSGATSYEWQRSGIDCASTPYLCNVYEVSQDHQSDVGLDFAYTSSGSCSAN